MLFAIRVESDNAMPPEAFRRCIGQALVGDFQRPQVAVEPQYEIGCAVLSFGGGQPELELANPISSEMSDMRPSLLPGLLAAAQRNADRGQGDVALFEVGQIYRGDKPEDQVTAASGIRRNTAAIAGATP